MNPTRFDRLSRALAAHGPRRRVLGLLTIGPGTYAGGNGFHVADIFGKTLTLIGAGSGPDGTRFVGGANPFGPRQRVVIVAGHPQVELRDLTVTGGGDSLTFGGGISNEAGSILTLTGVRVTGNTGQIGGGIFNDSTVILNAGTVVTGNTATVMGGGIYNSAGTVTRKPGRSVSGNTPDDCRLC